MLSDRLRGALLLLTLVITATIGSVHVILPFVPLIFVPPLRRAYRSVARFVEWAWFTLAAALIEWWMGVRVEVTGAPQHRADRVVVLMCNHHCRLDWLFLWSLATRRAWAGSLCIALKAPLKSAGPFGWAMQAFLFVFLSRSSREADLASLRRTLADAVRSRRPIAFLIFPEGTDISPTNLAKSHAHAEAKGLPRYEHVLHPRAAGLAAALQTLGPSLDALYDATVSYELHPEAVAEKAAGRGDGRPSERSLLRGTLPRVVRVHVRRTPASELPKPPPPPPPPPSNGGSGAAAAAASSSFSKYEADIGRLLKQRWADKEARLGAIAAPAAATTTATATGGGAGDDVPVVARASLPLEYVGALVGWGAAVALLVAALVARPATVGLGTVAGCVVLAALTKLCGGLDAMEMAMYDPTRLGTRREATPPVKSPLL